MPDTTRKSYSAVDFLKFICAVLVILIHVPPVGESSRFAYLYFIIRNCFTRIAVPLFFVSGGFFLFRKCDPELRNYQPVRGYLKKLLRMYFIWSAVYFPLQLREIHADGKVGLACGLEYLKDFLFVGSYYHLWYLNAAVAAVCLTCLCYRKLGAKRTLILSGALYCFGVLGQSWYGLIRPLEAVPWFRQTLVLYETIFETTRNGVFDGFLFTVIGMLFAFQKIRIPLRKALSGCCLSFLLLFAEFYGTFRLGMAKSYDLFLSLVPAVVFLFAAALALPWKDRPVDRVLRQCSTWMFYLHFWAAEIAGFLFRLWHQGENTSGIFVLTLVLTILLSLALPRLIHSLPRPRHK